MKVLIIGGVAGGASCAAKLRRLDEKAQIIMFERTEHISFANCGLPYYIGEVIKQKEKLLVQTPQAMNQRFNIDVRVYSNVTKIEREKKEVTVHDTKNNQVYTESYDKLVLAPGANPVKPHLKGLDDNNVFTLRSIPDTFAIKDFVDNQKPKHATIVGGGFIGLEIAENLKHRGLDVTIVEMANQVLATTDYEMASLIHAHLKSNNIKLELKDAIKEVENHKGYSKVILSSGKELKTDMIILAIGVRPEIQLAKDANLELGSLGGIKVDSTSKTSDDNIYAVGDAIEVLDYINANPTLIPLAGPANKQGRIVANNLVGKKDEYEGTQGTSVLKILDMTVATTGNNERILSRFNLSYQKSYTHSSSHAGYYPGASTISLKLLFHPRSGQILGAQAVGYEGVEKRIDVLATAIRAKMTVYDLEKLELSYAPPYSSAKDPVNIAGYVASNILKDDCSIIHANEISDLDLNKTLILDVRSKSEFEKGTIKGAINIPIDELRNKTNELSKDKKIIVFCQVGLRGYLAFRLLIQNGFTDVKNLSGGYKTYLLATNI